MLRSYLPSEKDSMGQQRSPFLGSIRKLPHVQQGGHGDSADRQGKRDWKERRESRPPDMRFRIPSDLRSSDRRSVSRFYGGSRGPPRDGWAGGASRCDGRIAI